MPQTCTLCRNANLHPFTVSEKSYFHCFDCGLRFISPKHHLNFTDEHDRYLMHENDADEPGYQTFVKPLVEEVLKKESQKSQGLDFGCGRSSSVSRLLENNGYTLNQFDPFFASDRQVLNQLYDYICACEVVEHFYEPGKEFLNLAKMLKPGGRLYIQTSLVGNETDFANWYYRKDPTHVSFYSRQTCEWIGNHFSFQSAEIVSSRVFILEK